MRIKGEMTDQHARKYMFGFLPNISATSSQNRFNPGMKKIIQMLIVQISQEIVQTDMTR